MKPNPMRVTWWNLEYETSGTPLKKRVWVSVPVLPRALLFVFLPPSPFSYKSLPLHFPAHLSLLMDWLHKMKRAWLAVSSRIRPRKSSGSVGRLGGGGGGGCCNGDYGLLNLRDDVHMCTYQDVQVMWNMLSGSQQNDVSSAKSVAHQPLESSKQRRPSWRLVFWSNRRDDTSSSFR